MFNTLTRGVKIELNTTLISVTHSLPTCSDRCTQHNIIYYYAANLYFPFVYLMQHSLKKSSLWHSSVKFIAITSIFFRCFNADIKFSSVVHDAVLLPGPVKKLRQTILFYLWVEESDFQDFLRDSIKTEFQVQHYFRLLALFQVKWKSIEYAYRAHMNRMGQLMMKALRLPRRRSAGFNSTVRATTQTSCKYCELGNIMYWGKRETSICIHE